MAEGIIQGFENLNIGFQNVLTQFFAVQHLGEYFYREREFLLNSEANDENEPTSPKYKGYL
jgi:hypothetical protein